MRQIAGVSLVFWALATMLVVWKWRVLPPELPLLYSLPDGEAQLGTRNGLGMVIGGFLVTTLVNIWFSVMLAKRDKLAGQFMMWAAAVVNFMMLVTVYKIVTLVAS